MLDAYTNTPGSFWTTPNSNEFLVGDQNAYATWNAGNQPAADGQYQDARSILESDTAQRNYGAGNADIEANLGNLNTNFAAAVRALGNSKKKDMYSLAESSADRGLTDSGIYLRSTNDLGNDYSTRESDATRARDQSAGGYARQQVNLSNTLASALATANTDAFTRRLAEWQTRRDQAIATATQRLRDAGLL
jgi:hypothetical protein